MPKWIRIQRQGVMVEENTTNFRRLAYQEHILITSGNDDSKDDDTPRLPAPKIDSRALLGLIPLGVMILRQVLKWRKDHSYPALSAGRIPALPAGDEVVIIEMHEPSKILESR